MIEVTGRNEATVQRTRREYIDRGFTVSLIGFDPARGLYAFDVIAAR